MNSTPFIRLQTAAFRGKTALRLPSFALLVVFTFTNVLFAHKPEAVLWQARRVRPSASAAAGPEIRLPALKTALTPRETAAHQDIVAGIRPWASVQTVLSAERPSSGRTVLIIQDIHGHAQAQAAIRDTLVHVAEQNPGVVVGFEGAAGPIHAADVRSPHAWVNSENAAILQNAGLLAGPDAAILLSPAGTRFIGLEDAPLYNANVAAVRAALATRAADTAAAVRRTDTTIAEIRGAGNDALAGLAERRRSAARGELPFPEFVAQLVEHARLESPSEQLTLFYRALKLERSLNLPRAETERAAAVREMAARLNARSLSALADLAADLSAGRIEHAAFYREFHRRASKAGLRWSRYPEFERYIRYAALSASIRADRLTSEAETALETLAARLARSDADREAWAAFRAAERGEKLAALSMTPAEWAAHAPRAGATPAERFYRLAEERNTAMLKAWRADAADARLGVIVTGGYHARAMAGALRRDADVIVLTPRLTDLKVGDYLSGFLAEPTPLDALFASPRVTLVRSLALQPIDGSGSGRGAARLAHELSTAIPEAARAGRAARTTAGRVLQVWRRGAPAPEAAGATVLETAGPNISVRVVRRRRWAPPLLSRHQSGNSPTNAEQRVREMGLDPDLSRVENEARQNSARTEAVKALANVFITHLRPVRDADVTTPEALRAVVTRPEFLTDLAVNWARLQRIAMNLNLLRGEDREFLNRLVSGAGDTGFCLFAANTGVRTIQFNNRALAVEVVQVPYKRELFHAYIRVRFPGNPTAYALDFAPVQFFGPAEPVVLQPENEYFDRLMGVAGRLLSEAGQRELLEGRIANIGQFTDLEHLLDSTLPGGADGSTLITRGNRDNFPDWPIWAVALIVAPLDEAVDSFRPLEFHRSHGPQSLPAAVARWVGIAAIWIGILATPFVIGLLGAQLMGAGTTVPLAVGGIFAAISAVSGRRLGRDGANALHWILAAPGLAGSVAAHAAYNFFILISAIVINRALEALLSSRGRHVNLHGSILSYPLMEQLNIALRVVQSQPMAEKFRQMGKGTVTIAYAPHPEAPPADLLSELRIREEELSAPGNVRSALRYDPRRKSFTLNVIIGPAIANDLIRYLVHHVGTRPAEMLRGDMHTPEGRRDAELAALNETRRILGQVMGILPGSTEMLEIQGKIIESARTNAEHQYAVEAAPPVTGANPIHLLGVRHDDDGVIPTIDELDRIAATLPPGRPIVFWMELGGYADNNGTVMSLEGLQERLEETILEGREMGEIIERIRGNDPVLKNELAVMFQLSRHIYNDIAVRDAHRKGSFIGAIRGWVRQQRENGRVVLFMTENPDFESQWDDLRARVEVEYPAFRSESERPSDVMIAGVAASQRKESLFSRDMPFSQSVADATRRYPGATHIIVRGAKHEDIVGPRLAELGAAVSRHTLLPDDAWVRYVEAGWPGPETDEGRRLILIMTFVSMMHFIPGAPVALANRVGKALLELDDEWIEKIARHVDAMNTINSAYVWLWSIWYHLPETLADTLREFNAAVRPAAPYWFAGETLSAISIRPRLEAVDSMAPVRFVRRHRSETYWDAAWLSLGATFIIVAVMAVPTVIFVLPTFLLYGGDASIQPAALIAGFALSGIAWAAGYRLERETRPGARILGDLERVLLRTLARPALLSSMLAHMIYNMISVATAPLGRWRIPPLTLPGIRIDPSLETFSVSGRDPPF